MTHMRLFGNVLLLLAGLGAGSTVSAQRPSIGVAAASDLQSVMPEIAKSFANQTGAHVEISFGSSGNFFTQIQNGAPFDLFFSADREFPQKLIESGHAEPRSAVVYAVGSLVLWMPASARCDLSAEKWNCLMKPEVTKIAIANPAHAPYGRAAVEALQSAHLYAQLRSKLVFGENISQAAQFVQSGNAQAGILARSQTSLPAMRGGKLWEVPRDSYPRIEQTAVVLKRARNRSLAEQFVKFVAEGPGRGLLQQAGFQPVPPAESRERHR